MFVNNPNEAVDTLRNLHATRDLLRLAFSKSLASFLKAMVYNHIETPPCRIDVFYRTGLLTLLVDVLKEKNIDCFDSFEDTNDAFYPTAIMVSLQYLIKLACGGSVEFPQKHITAIEDCVQKLPGLWDSLLKVLAPSAVMDQITYDSVGRLDCELHLITIMMSKESGKLYSMIQRDKVTRECIRIIVLIFTYFSGGYPRTHTKFSHLMLRTWTYSSTRLSRTLCLREVVPSFGGLAVSAEILLSENTGTNTILMLSNILEDLKHEDHSSIDTSLTLNLLKPLIKRYFPNFRNIPGGTKCCEIMEALAFACERQYDEQYIRLVIGYNISIVRSILDSVEPGTEEAVGIIGENKSLQVFTELLPNFATPSSTRPFLYYKDTSDSQKRYTPSNQRR
ncbi:hypothetical protein QCA50_008995 [Cerrena zonata]|uniref:Uncharacterized protein n=1 Tax=Cerrena zonata TaxID=2478898 RepID=A0AAW0G4I2_9APHY